MAIVETARNPALWAIGAVVALSRYSGGPIFCGSLGFRENEKFRTMTKLIWDGTYIGSDERKRHGESDTTV